MIHACGLAGLVACAGLACSVDSRSEAFECSSDNQCGGGRICEQRWCVLGVRDSGVADAPPGIDAFACPAACTDCVAGTCVIDCANPNSCGEGIVCPAGLDCEVNCDGADSCAGAAIDCSDSLDCRINCAGDGSCSAAITCTGSGDCRVDCDGDSSCSGPITSGAGPTDINCAGVAVCTGAVDCSASCACEVDCTDTCPAPASCPMDATCATPEGGCDNLGACDTC